jgi:hypothetical protein
VFTGIDLEFGFRGHVDSAAVERAIGQAETRVCPVWTMLKTSVPITSSFRIDADGALAPLPPPKPQPPKPRRRTVADMMGALGFFLAVISIVVGLVQIVRWVGQLFL